METLPDTTISTLIKARDSYTSANSPYYDEVLIETSARISKNGSVGKTDIGALLFWKRLNASTRWVRSLMEISDRNVRTITTKMVHHCRNLEISADIAATRARSELSHLPGFASGDAMASAVIYAAAPNRMAVYDSRAQKALDRLDISLSAKPGRYGRYIRILDEIRSQINFSSDEGWTARDVDLALFNLGK